MVTISGFPLPLIPVAKGMMMAGKRMPAMTIRMIISMSVKPFLFIPITRKSSRIRNIDLSCIILNPYRPLLSASDIPYNNVHASTRYWLAKRIKGKCYGGAYYYPSC